MNEFKINFNKVKRLTLTLENEDLDFSHIENIDYQYFFKEFFSINDISSNLIYLKINLEEINTEKINPEIFEGINRFNALKYLFLNSFPFNENFIIKLTTLRILSIKNCENIYLSDDCCLSLESFKYINNKMTKNINILENHDFKELIELNLHNNEISDINLLSTVKFEKIKIFHLSENIISDIKILEKIKSEKLEKLNLSKNKIKDINILEKLNIKELKKLYLNNNEIIDIQVFQNVKKSKISRIKNNRYII